MYRVDDRHGPVRVGSASTSDLSADGLRRVVVRAVLRALDPPAPLDSREDLIVTLVDTDTAVPHTKVTLAGAMAEFATEHGCRRIDMEWRSSGSRRIATCVLVRYDHTLTDTEDEW